MSVPLLDLGASNRHAHSFWSLLANLGEQFYTDQRVSWRILTKLIDGAMQDS